MHSILFAAARLQFASMLRELLPWTTAAAAIWVIFVTAQEPGFARRFDVPFLAPSLRLGAVALGGLLGVAAAEGGASSWRALRDRSRRPIRVMLGLWLGGLVLAVVAAVLFAACAAGASAVFGRQMTPFGGLVCDSSVMVLVAANTLALAPAVAACGRGLAFRVVVWTLLAASSSGAFGFSAPIPIPVLWAASSLPDAAHLVPIGSALLASLCVAAVACRREIHPNPDSR